MSRTFCPAPSPYHRPALVLPARIAARVHQNVQVPVVLRTAGILLLGLTIGVAATYALLISLGGGSRESKPSRAARPVKQAVIAQGTLQPRNGPVLIGSALVGYQIQKVAVKEGDLVAHNQVLVELDPAAAQQEHRIAESQQTDAEQRRNSELEIAQQRLKAADLAVKQAEDARQLELEIQQQRIDVAELKVKQAENELRRMKALNQGDDPIVSAQQVEQQQVLRELSLAERNAAKAALARLEQSLDFQLQKAHSEQQTAQSALQLAERGTALEALASQVALSQLKLNQTKVLAPLAGTVINVNVHPGEVVTTQPLLQIADLSDMLCIAEVDVSDVPLLKERAVAVVSSRAFHGRELRGRIERIGNLAGSATLRQVDPRQAVDRTVTSVTLRIDAREAMQALGGDEQSVGAALVGLQVDVKFTVGSASD